MFVLKLDKNGNILWVNTYEDPSPTYAAIGRSSVATKNNQILITGTLFSPYFLGNAMIVMKLNQDGTLANGKLFGRNKQGIEPFKTKEDKLGNLVTLGRAWKTRDYTNTQRPYFLKIDSTVAENIIYSKRHNSRELYSTLNIGRRKRSNYFLTGTTDKRSYGLNDFGIHTVFTDGTTSCITSKDLVLETISWNPKIIASDKTETNITTGSFALVEKVSTYAQVHILCATSNDTVSLALNAWAVNAINRLQWITGEAQETTATDFAIERSADGTNFKQIATTQTGSYSDLKPLAGINYYRIRFTQANGSSGYSDIKIVAKNTPFNAVVFTNPVTENSLILNINNEKPTTIQFIITNTAGKIMLTQKTNITAGTHTKKLNVSAFANGVYFIKIISDAEQVTLKFVKQ